MIDLHSKILEFIKAAQMPLTEQVFAALVTAYGVNGYVRHNTCKLFVIGDTDCESVC